MWLLRHNFPKRNGRQPQQAERRGNASARKIRFDPIIRGLLARLPKSGAVWPEAERKLWLDLLVDNPRPSVGSAIVQLTHWMLLPDMPSE